MTSEIILQAIVTGLMMGLIYALIAAGLSLIFGLMDIVNFAHGEHLMLSMFSSFWLWSLFGLDPIFSIPITILLMAFCGVITHYFLIRYILKAKMLIQICATFGLSIFIRSIAQLLWTPDFRNVDKPLLEGRLEIGSVFIGQPQLVASLVCLVAFKGLYLFVTKTYKSLNEGSINKPPKDSTSPIIIPAYKHPMILPNPPRATATKANKAKLIPTSVKIKK